ncbi:hypothetical protein ID852_08425 [Xenorhabdus sp. 42]|uniref:DUF6973 domain-containing protein n=1 Tax=Xenorhabdus szentirmaii TaxID=290112 RepID=UPI0019AFAFDE|nr:MULTISPECIES: hypothetical protein [unclassified Xenorhabdus]MBD2780845.1 hypothetical protein [Xenorhabdus sp. 38]MBD2820717.1 hypothetical protein [Xenorhabdus sp. 42]
MSGIIAYYKNGVPYTSEGLRILKIIPDRINGRDVLNRIRSDFMPSTPAFIPGGYARARHALTLGATYAPDGGMSARDMMNFWKEHGAKDGICPVCSRKNCPYLKREMERALEKMGRYNESLAVDQAGPAFAKPFNTIKNQFNSTAPVVMSHLSLLENKTFDSTTDNLKGLFADRFLLDSRIGEFKSLSSNTQTTLQIFAYGGECRDPKFNSFYHHMGSVEGSGRGSRFGSRNYDLAMKELYNNMKPTLKNIYVLDELVKEFSNDVSSAVKDIGKSTTEFLAGAFSNSNGNSKNIVENQYNWAIPGTGVKSKWQRDIQQYIFGLANMNAALEIGMYAPGTTNISTNAARFSTLGDSNKYPHGVLQENGSFEGSQVNAFRHALWQATITAKFGEETASRIADAHETYRTLDLNVRHFKTLSEADQTIDMLNNPQGREVGMKNTDATQKTLAKEVLNHFHKNGLYVAKKDASGYAVVSEKITNKQFNYMNSEIDRTNKNGFTPEAVEKMKNEPLVVRDYPG